MTATADTILAIDLGRFKSVACVYSRSTRNHAFRTIDSKPDRTRSPNCSPNIPVRSS